MGSGIGAEGFASRQGGRTHSRRYNSPQVPSQPTSWTSDLAARYELLEEAGRGGMGVVYKARDRETGEIVALKILKPEIAADRVAAERFINEVRLSRRITHKNVCRVYEFTRAGA